MKKVKAPEEIVGVMPLSNTAVVVIAEVSEYGESVKYYLSTVGNNHMIELHNAKIYYRIKDNAPYFNSIVGRMLLDNFMKY